MALSSKERASLRSDAHHLTALVHVGHNGITPAIQQSLDDALRTKELVKIQFTKTADVDLKAAAGDLAKAVEADVVQVIGRTVTLYRENRDLELKGDLPAWRR
jgi:Predicted RNA-binding protein containing KH domain, possibly ribosomal protein